MGRTIGLSAVCLSAVAVLTGAFGCTYHQHYDITGADAGGPDEPTPLNPADAGAVDTCAAAVMTA